MKKSSRINFNLGMYTEPVAERLRSWKDMNYLSRLWEKDPKLWFLEPRPEIRDRLGWLDLPENMSSEIDKMEAYAHSVKNRGIEHIILLGMGGSSLAPETFFQIFENKPGFPDLTILDSTHPDAVSNTTHSFDLNRTVFLVSSKSGTTLETLSLFRYFWAEMSRVSPDPGRHFAAITDAGSSLAELAESRGFDAVFFAPEDVGGRFSALSYFGMVPAAMIGLDLSRFLSAVKVAVEGNSSAVGEEASDGLRLGAVLAEIGLLRDKITFFVSPSLSGFPDWLEQLIAESLGKDGKGIVPIVGEPGMLMDSYGEDRFFIIYRLEGEDNPELGAVESNIERRGYPAIVLPLSNRYEIGGEMFRWELAVAAAGSAMGVHPFNQPDVQLAKSLTRDSMESSRQGTSRTEESIDEYTLENPEDLRKALSSWLSSIHPNHYVAVQAYLKPSQAVKAALQNLRLELLRKTELATTLGIGPRFLHSTGQLHKGGANTGLFLQLVDMPETDLPVPETDYTFSALIKAQANGDYLALQKRGRKVLRINLGPHVIEGLEKLKTLVN